MKQKFKKAIIVWFLITTSFGNGDTPPEMGYRVEQLNDKIAALPQKLESPILEAMNSCRERLETLVMTTESAYANLALVFWVFNGLGLMGLLLLFLYQRAQKKDLVYFLGRLQKVDSLGEISINYKTRPHLNYAFIATASLLFIAVNFIVLVL